MRLDFSAKEHSPSLLNSLLFVDADAGLKVRGLYNECQIPLSLSVINDIRQLSLLLDEIMDHTPDKIEFWIKKAASLLKECLTELENLDDVADYKFPSLIDRLHFIIGQLDNSLQPKNRRRYDLIRAQLISSACYKYL